MCGSFEEVGQVDSEVVEVNDTVEESGEGHEQGIGGGPGDILQLFALLAMLEAAAAGDEGAINVLDQLAQEHRMTETTQCRTGNCRLRQRDTVINVVWKTTQHSTEQRNDNRQDSTTPLPDLRRR